MPMTTTHALVPLAAAVAFAPRPISWRLVIVAMLAAALPDIDGAWNYLLHIPTNSIYAHRGAAHSLFVALLAGLVAAAFHRRLRVRPLTAALVVGASMASHGLLDMLTDRGHAVAYFWPVSSDRFFADWRPIHSTPVHMRHLLQQGLERFQSELWQLILPMFAVVVIAVLIRSWFSRRPDSPYARSVVNVSSAE